MQEFQTRFQPVLVGFSVVTGSRFSRRPSIRKSTMRYSDRAASVSLAIVLLLTILEQSSLAAHLPVTSPEQLGFDEARLKRIPELVEQGIQEGKMPGCVVCFGRQGKIAYLQAFGHKQVQPEVAEMTVDTVFDMASITKPVATGTAIMKLIEEGRIRLGSKVIDFFPEFGSNGKDAITVKDLLIHQSGLIPDNPLSDYMNGPEVAWQRICELPLVAPVGTTFKYSDVNFIVLAKLVEQISGMDVHVFTKQHVFEPLGMAETGFVPQQPLRDRSAPTEQRDGQWIQGQVHDPRAFRLEGIAGHAGLFSTATDLAIYASMMLGKGALQIEGQPTVQILSPATVDLMTREFPVSSGQRGLSWDRRTGYSSNRGDLLSEQAFGHGGFTGTVLWIDPGRDLFFIFLSNRLHPDGKGLVNPLAGQIANVIASSLGSPDQPPALRRAQVLTGFDVLQQDNFRQLSGQRLGLITNHTGRSLEGGSIVSLLNGCPEIDLEVLFSPEHGFEGKLDIAKIDDARDESTGLKIYSLYGQTRRPTAEMCQSIDTFVFDIQDIGARFYTYISTMGEAMIAASEFGKRFVVLDRPNPIGGIAVAGPMLDPGSESLRRLPPFASTPRYDDRRNRPNAESRAGTCCGPGGDPLPGLDQVRPV
jgi:CubicO group peptidase (beta-lactamase class C family)